MRIRSLARASQALAAAAWLAATCISATPLQAQPAGSAPTLASGYAALDAERFDDAAAIASQLLGEAPGSHAAALLRIAALAYGSDPLRAVPAYDAWRQGQNLDHPLLLAVIGEGIARHVATTAKDPALRLAAARLLVDRQVPGARDRFMVIARAAGPAGAAAMAAAGDQAAARQAAASLSKLHGSARTRAIEQLAGTAEPSVLQAIEASLADPDPMVRIAAAKALGASPDKEAAVPHLQRLLEDPSGEVQRAAAVSLVRLGQASGEAVVESMLASGIGDLVLAAAEALPESPERWSDRVRPLLQSDDPVERLRAAGLLKAVSPAEAAAVISQALADENAMLREEAAKTALDAGGLGPGSWRQLVQDSNGWVRLAGARILMTGAAPL